jgi:hypothetical protein
MAQQTRADMNDEAFRSLTPEQQKIAAEHKLVTVCGKRNR